MKESYYHEASVQKFVQLGLVSVLVLVAIGWFLRSYALKEVRTDTIETTRPSGAAQLGSEAP